jgi:hypothetical protein
MNANLGYGEGVLPNIASNTGNTTVLPDYGVDTGGVQIKNPSRNGNIAGGGYGAGATVTASPIVLNINGADQTVQLPSIIEPDRAIHILTGDGPGSGGHQWPGEPGKTPFPQSWDADRILGNVSDVATDPASVVQPVGRGRVAVTGTRDGVEIRVILERPNHAANPGRVVTAYPTNLPRNP